MLRYRCLALVQRPGVLLTGVKSHSLFHTVPSLLIKANKLPPRPKLPEGELEEVFLKGGRGPGGQKINKTNSKVQLKHIPTGIMVTCQATRSQSQNRKKAREILGMKVQHSLNPEESRQQILEDRKSQQNSSKRKKTTKKYKELEEERKVLKDQQEREELEFLQRLMVNNEDSSSSTNNER
jgi:protein subunit release factor B